MPDTIPKVLIILDTIEIGGPGKGIFQYCAHKPNSIDVVLSNFDYGDGGQQTFNRRAEELGLPLVKLRQRNRLDFSCMDKLIEVVRRENIALVQSHNFKSHLVARGVAKRAGVPWLAFAHGWTAETIRVHAYNLWDRIQLRQADHIVAVSRELKRKLEDSGVRGARISVIHNAVDASRARLKPAKTESTKLNLLCVGRLSFEKGQDLLLEAIHRADMRVDWNLEIVGDGPMKDRLTKRVTRLGIEDRVSFVGFVRDVQYYYEKADLLVVPSRSEGLPNALLEAMAAGIPSLATSVGGVPEVVEHGKTGWLVDCDIDSFAAQLKKLSEDSRKLANVGSRAREFVKENNDPSGRARQIVKCQLGLLRSTGMT